MCADERYKVLDDTNPRADRRRRSRTMSRKSSIADRPQLETEQELVDAGICTQCKKRPVKKDRKKCKKCLDGRNSSRKKTYRENVQAGVCGNCGIEPIAPPSKALCRTCADSRAAEQESRRQKGLCARCGKNDRHKKLTRCLDCIEALRVYRSLRKARAAK